MRTRRPGFEWRIAQILILFRLLHGTQLAAAALSRVAPGRGGAG